MISDITPLAHIYQGYTEHKAFSLPVPEVETLKARITDALAVVTKEKLEITWQDVESHLEVFKEHNEHMVKFTNKVKKKRCMYSSVERIQD